MFTLASGIFLHHDQGSNDGYYTTLLLCRMWQILFIAFWFRKMMIIPLHIYVKATIPLVYY